MYSIVRTDQIDDQMFNLQQACNRHDDPLAIWVLYAISRHINTGKVTRMFEGLFCKLTEIQLSRLITECLNGDKSDNGIIKSTNKFFLKEKVKIDG